VQSVAELFAIYRHVSSKFVWSWKNSVCIMQNLLPEWKKVR